MRVLACGSRTWNDRKTIFDTLDEIGPSHLIVGGAKGADHIAQLYAVINKITHTVVYPDWKTYGKRAGYHRNLLMLDEKPHLVVAFWDGHSGGTAHTVNNARKRGIPVMEIVVETT